MRTATPHAGFSFTLSLSRLSLCFVELCSTSVNDHPCCSRNTVIAPTRATYFAACSHCPRLGTNATGRRPSIFVPFASTVGAATRSGGGRRTPRNDTATANVATTATDTSEAFIVAPLCGGCARPGAGSARQSLLPIQKRGQAPAEGAFDRHQAQQCQRLAGRAEHQVDV